MAIGIIVGRLAGLAREVSIATRFGTGETADVVVLMLAVPDFLVNILVGGALSAALIPEFKRLGKDVEWCLFVQSSFVVGPVPGRQP